MNMLAAHTRAIQIAVLLLLSGCGTYSVAGSATDAGLVAVDADDIATTRPASFTPKPRIVPPYASWLRQWETETCSSANSAVDIHNATLARVTGDRGHEWVALGILLQQTLSRPEIVVPVERDIIGNDPSNIFSDTWPFYSYYFIDLDSDNDNGTVTAYVAVDADIDVLLNQNDELVELLAYISGRHPTVEYFRLAKFQRAAWPDEESYGDYGEEGAYAVYLSDWHCTLSKAHLAEQVPLATMSHESELALLSQRLARIGTLQGAAIDGGKLVLFGTPRDEHSPRALTLDDLARAYRSVRYQCDCPESNEFEGHSCESAFVSIDPDIDDPLGPANVVLAPCLQDSRMGRVFLDADILIKEMAHGYYLGRGEPRAMPHGHQFESDYVADIAATTGAASVRYWFFAHPNDPSVPIRISDPAQRRARSKSQVPATQWIDVGGFHLTLGIEVTSADGQILSTDEPELRTRLPAGNTRHPAHAFAIDINHHYTTRYARFFPELSELDNAVRLIEIMGWIDTFYAEDHPEIIALLERLPLSYEPTPRQVALSVGASVPIIHSAGGTTTAQYISYGGVTSNSLVRGSNPAARAAGASENSVVVVRVPGTAPKMVEASTRKVQQATNRAFHSEQVSANFLAYAPGSIQVKVVPIHKADDIAGAARSGSNTASATAHVTSSVHTSASSRISNTIKRTEKNASTATSAAPKAVISTHKAISARPSLVSVQADVLPTRISVNSYRSAAPTRGPPSAAGPVSLERGRIVTTVQARSSTPTMRARSATNAEHTVAATRIRSRSSANKSSEQATYHSGAGVAGVAGVGLAARRGLSEDSETETRVAEEEFTNDAETDTTAEHKRKVSRTQAPGGVRAGGRGARHAERHPARILADRMDVLGSSVAVGLPVLANGDGRPGTILPPLLLESASANDNDRQLLLTWMESNTRLHVGAAAFDVTPEFAGRAQLDDSSWQRIHMAWTANGALLMSHWPGALDNATAAARALWWRRATHENHITDNTSTGQPRQSLPITIVGYPTGNASSLRTKWTYLHRSWASKVPQQDAIGARLQQVGGASATGWQNAHTALDIAMGPGFVAVQRWSQQTLEDVIMRQALLHRLHDKIVIVRQSQFSDSSMRQMEALLRAGYIGTLVILAPQSSDDAVRHYLKGMARRIRQGWPILAALTQGTEARPLAPVLVLGGDALR